MIFMIESDVTTSRKLLCGGTPSAVTDFRVLRVWPSLVKGFVYDSAYRTPIRNRVAKASMLFVWSCYLSDFIE